jgi:hypothetical protein
MFKDSEQIVRKIDWIAASWQAAQATPGGHGHIHRSKPPPFLIGRALRGNHPWAILVQAATGSKPGP